MDDERKDYPDPKRTPKRNRPKQLQTHNVPTDDIENTNSKNQGGDLLFANRKDAAREKENKRSILHCSTHLQGELNEKEKYSYGVDWRPKRIQYCLTKLDNRPSQNIQDIRQSL